MDSSTIKRKQARAISAALYPCLNYLRRLQVRMEKVGFPPDDPLYKLVASAYDAVLRLHGETHYLSCKGVGRPSTEGDDATMRDCRRCRSSPRREIFWDRMRPEGGAFLAFFA
jgi:hypothetical protein